MRDVTIVEAGRHAAILLARIRGPASVAVCLRHDRACPERVVVEAVALTHTAAFQEGLHMALRLAWGVLDGEPAEAPPAAQADDPFAPVQAIRLPTPAVAAGPPGHAFDASASGLRADVWRIIAAGADPPVPLTPPAIRRWHAHAVAGELGALLDEACGSAAAHFGLEWEESDGPSRRVEGIALRRRLEKAGHRLWSDLAENLDVAEGVAALAAEDEPAPEAIAWYGHRDPVECGRPVGRWRRQAAMSMPLLAGLFAADRGMRTAIDAGRSISKVTLERYPGLGRSGVQRIGRIRHPGAPRRPLAAAWGAGAAGDDIMGVRRERTYALGGGWDVAEALEALSRCGVPNLVPMGDDEWRSFTTLFAGAMKPMAAHLGACLDDMIRSGKGGERGWRTLEAAVAGDFELDRIDRLQLNLAVLDAAHLVDLAAWQLLVPAAARLANVRDAHGTPLVQETFLQPPAAMRLDRLETLRTAAIGLLMRQGRQPLRAMAKFVRRGVTRMNAIEAAAENLLVQPEARSRTDVPSWWRSRSRWERPAADRVDGDGWTLRFLCSSEELKAEGAAMRHCIGGSPHYRGKLRDGWAMAAAVEPPGGGDGRATVFVRWSQDDGRWYVGDINGPRNRNPGQAARNAVKRWLRRVNDGTEPLRPGFAEYCEWARQRAARRRGRGPRRLEWRQICGHDPFDEEQVRAMWNAWRDLVPGGRKRGSFDEMAEKWLRNAPEGQRLTRAVFSDTFGREAKAPPRTPEARARPRP